MQRPAPMQPWDDGAMTAALMKLVPTLPRVRLDEIQPPNQPGCYLQFFDTEAVKEVLGETIASGRYPAYVGVAACSLRERVGRYRQSVDGLDCLREREIHLALLPCASAAAALYSERVLIDRLHPVLNGTGWGSKVPGANRTSQRCSPVDALFPGRRWATAPSLRDRAMALMRVVESLATLGPETPRWPALGRSPREASSA